MDFGLSTVERASIMKMLMAWSCSKVASQMRPASSSRYPADPNDSVANIVNCRCAAVAAVSDYKAIKPNRSPETNSDALVVYE